MYYFLKCEWFIGFDYDLWLLYSMFWGVSNYSLLAMERTNFCIFLFLVFLTSLCNSNDYKYYDDYKYDDYIYDYDYDNQKPEDYIDDYSQELNEYYDQNLLAPPNPPAPPMSKMTFFSILNMMKYRLPYAHQ